MTRQWWAKFWTGLGLVQDHKDRTKIKGMNHILPTFIGVGLYLVFASGYSWFNPWCVYVLLLFGSS